MNDKIKEKIIKVYELVKRGIAGEQQSAEKMLNKLLEKYNISVDDLIDEKKYYFKYASNLDEWLLMQLIEYFFKEKNYKLYRIKDSGVKEIAIQMPYLDWVTLDSAYGYFKPHLNQQWRKHGLPIVNRCRTTKTKNKCRIEMQDSFFKLYVVRSGIYRPEQITSNPLSEEKIKQLTMLYGIEGGKYTQQLTTGLYLE